MREVWEETRLTVLEIGQVVYTCHIVDRQNNRQTLAIIHEVTAWEGQLGINDPDDLILTVKFCPREEAVENVGRGLNYAPMRDPIVAYLRGDVSAGATWLYERTIEETIELVTQIGD
jgi:ADP-ribose pyrophosphatase YjhB (NUDIX family)